MSNPRQHQEPYKRLAEINRAITTSLNFDEVLNLIVTSASQLVHARATALLLLDKDGLLRIRASEGLDAETIGSFTSPVQEDVVKQLHGSLGVADNETLFTVPVIAKWSLSGILLITRVEPITPEEEWQLSALADQAAIALRNAQLYEMELAEASRERNETLEALRESNLKIKTVLESITDLFYSLDREWRFTDVNRQTEMRFGKSRDELIGKVIWEVFPAAVQTPLYTNFHKALDEMVPMHFELASAIVPNTWFEAHAYPSESGLTAYLRDISERKRSERTSHLLASIVESSDDAIVSKNLDGIIQSWNKGAERVFGYKEEEVLGKPITIIIPDERLDEEPRIVESIRRGVSVDHFETVRKRKDGTLLDISLTISPIKDELGKVIGASKIARDITDRIRRDQELVFQAHLLDAVEQGVIATDLKGKIVYWNAFAEKLYGWTAEEALGRSVLDLTPAVGMRESAEEIIERIRRGESWAGEFQTRTKDGQVFPAMVTDSPIYDVEGSLIGIVGVSVDVSDRKRAEIERAQLLESERQARNDAETANRLKDEFLATLSHELRNPLNVILGYSEVLLRSEEAKRSPFLVRAAEVLKRNALAQSQLVRDLLDLSRLHMGKLSLNKEPLSLTTTIENAVETVRAEAAAKNITLKIDTSDEVIFIDGDPLRMEQVIWNLLNNSVKFTPAGGTVTARLTRDGNEAVLTVEDTGQGIEPSFLPHVFEMFRQADATSSRKYGGMGIGLALVQELVQLQDGTVSVDSGGIGKGATFTIRLPSSPESRLTPSMAPPVAAGALNEMRILVVDDSVDTVDMLRRLFEMDGATVNTAKSGVEALEKIRAERFDVILSDISMPGMDGFELLRRLRALPGGGNVPVLALTGFGRVEDVERAKAEGFFSHVTKPIDVGLLVKILQKLPDRVSQTS